MVKKLMKDFDTDGNSISVTKRKDIKSSIERPGKIMWGEVDNLVYEGRQKKIPKFKLLTWDFNRCLLEVILGIAILTFLSGPLMTSIQQFSDSIGMPSFFISFVIVPVSMNARSAISAISAIFPASRKSSRTSSLTFPQIYGGVVMNNIMGLSTLLAIVYIKDLKWDYSAEVLTVLVVCAIIRLLACSETIYSLWTCLLKFSFYPFSLTMYYVLQYVMDWD